MMNVYVISRCHVLVNLYIEFEKYLAQSNLMDVSPKKLGFVSTTNTRFYKICDKYVSRGII